MSTQAHSSNAFLSFSQKKGKIHTLKDRNQYINCTLNIESFYSQFQQIGTEIKEEAI